MPYITQERRDALFNDSLEDTNDAMESAGELNYMITGLLKRYIDHKGLKYDTINDIIGALEGAKLEFYRRVAVPYENVKLTQNGDVYSHD